MPAWVTWLALGVLAWCTLALVVAVVVARSSALLHNDEYDAWRGYGDG